MLKVIFAIAGIVTGVLGVLWLVFPQTMLAGLAHPQPDAITVYMARRYGALFVGYAAILWLGRTSPPSPARTAILVGGIAVAAVIGVVSVLGAVTGVVGPAIWGALLIEAVLACGFVSCFVAAQS
jgi:hypothetical protein